MDINELEEELDKMDEIKERFEQEPQGRISNSLQAIGVWE